MPDVFLYAHSGLLGWLWINTVTWPSVQNVHVNFQHRISLTVAHYFICFDALLEYIQPTGSPQEAMAAVTRYADVQLFASLLSGLPAWNYRQCVFDQFHFAPHTVANVSYGYQCRMVLSYGRFGPTCRSHLQESSTVPHSSWTPWHLKIGQFVPKRR
jgi:hypothetical protein